MSLSIEANPGGDFIKGLETICIENLNINHPKSIFSFLNKNENEFELIKNQILALYAFEDLASEKEEDLCSEFNFVM